MDGDLLYCFLHAGYSFLKRRYPKRLKTLLGVHILGNLVSFMFVSAHYAHQLGRPRQFYPKLGTGVTLYTTLLLLVSTGFFQRFGLGRRLGRYWRFVHVSVTMSFYIIILVHVLHGLGII